MYCERQANPVPEVAQGTVWDFKGSVFILEEAIKSSAQMGVLD